MTAALIPRTDTLLHATASGGTQSRMWPIVSLWRDEAHGACAEATSVQRNVISLRELESVRRARASSNMASLQDIYGDHLYLKENSFVDADLIKVHYHLVENH